MLSCRHLGLHQAERSGMKAEVCGAFKVLKGKSNLRRDPSFRVQVGGVYFEHV